MTTKAKKFEPAELNYRDLQIMHSQEVEHDTYPETMKKLDVGHATIARAKKKAAYRQLVIDSLAERKTTADTYADNLIELMKADKGINVRGSLVKMPDNIARFNANSEFGDILGVKAPKELDLKHTMAAMGDDELQDAVNSSVKELNGHIKRSIAGTLDAEAVVTNTIADERPELVERPGEQATGSADS